MSLTNPDQPREVLARKYVLLKVFRIIDNQVQYQYPILQRFTVYISIVILYFYGHLYNKKLLAGTVIILINKTDDIDLRK